MRVLLTGHLGYIGAVLTPMLVKAGHEVVGFDADLYSRCTFAAGGTLLDVPAMRNDTRHVSRECRAPERYAEAVFGRKLVLM
jgi:nucleoside-diphosphate-sugar epimerase